MSPVDYEFARLRALETISESRGIGPRMYAGSLGAALYFFSMRGLMIRARAGSLKTSGACLMTPESMGRVMVARRDGSSVLKRKSSSTASVWRSTL